MLGYRTLSIEAKIANEQNLVRFRTLVSEARTPREARLANA